MEPPTAEDIIAIVSALPSGIVTYMSVHYDLFPSSIRAISYILAIAIGSTIALHFEALRVLGKSGKAWFPSKVRFSVWNHDS
jgi:hypothetical protein